MIPVKCTNCQKSYRPVGDEFAGRKVTCQACKTVFVIAGPSAAAAPAVPAKPVAQTLAPQAKAAPPPAAPKPAAAQPPAPAKPPVKPAAPAPVAPAAKAAAPPGPPRQTVTQPAIPRQPATQPPAAAPKPAAPATVKPAAAQAPPAKPPAPGPKPASAETVTNNSVTDTPPPKAPAAAPTTIDFRCPQCDTDVKLPLTMAGKNAPCPECKRIVRVPIPAAKQPTDWRKVNTGGPSMAKKAPEEELAGVWDTNKVERVTGGELVRAGVIEEKREPWSRWQKIRLGLIILVVAGLGLGGYVGARTFWAHSQEEKALRKALDAAESKDAPLDPLSAAEVYRGAGEFYGRAGNDQFEMAREQFLKALARLDSVEGLPERDALLVDIAAGQAGLILEPAQIAKAKQRNLAQKQQDQVMEDLLNTLARMRAPDARREAIRQITRILLAKKQPDRAAELAAPGVVGDDQLEVLGIVGLERLRAGQTAEAGILADMALETAKGPPAPKGKKEIPRKVVVAPSLVALCVLLKKPEDKLALLQPRSGSDASVVAWHAGNAEAAAIQKNLDGARGYTQNLQHLDTWRVLAVIAGAGLDQEPPVTADVEQLVKYDAATLAQLASDERKATKGPTKADPSWLLLRLVQRAARLPNQEDLAKKLAECIPDPALRARARLILLQARLQRTGSPAPDDWANEVDAPTVNPLAREALARHNARAAGSGPTLKAVDGWTPENLRPFGYIGAALGIQDGIK